MKRSTITFLLALLLTAGLSLPSYAGGPATITGHLAGQMKTTGVDEMIRINITMTEQFNVQELLSGVKSMDKENRRKQVIQTLKDFTTQSQQEVIAELNFLQQAESVKDVNAFWVANVISCKATPAAIEQIAYLEGVASVDYDELRTVVDPMENKNAQFIQGNAGSKEITWNITKVNADDVWALGLTGEGIIVSVIDTGVNYDHLDLEDHMWESEEYPNHGWDFYFNDDDPKDEYGHGTHCAGTVAGDGTAGSQTGVAPDALIMACKVTNAAASSAESMIWDAVEFSIEQGAHVISLSMGWQHSWGTNRQVWRQTFDAVLAAGMVASVAAGNEGDQQGSYPIPDNVRSPGDCPPPWLNPDQTLTGGTSSVICVGSTTSGDFMSSFSSRGPVTWELINPFNDYPHNPEMGLIRPDVVAPGSNIKSLAHYSNTGYESGWSGTSMATPANAGMIALMLQKNQQLTPEQISQIAEETTYVLTTGKNNNSGAGRIDCLAAVEAVSFPGPSYYEHTLNDATGNNDGLINPGESISVTLSIANFSDEEVTGVTVELSTSSEYITFSDNTEYFGDFSVEDIIEVADAFAFDVAEEIPGGEMIEFIVTAYNDDNTWESGFTEMAHAVNLVMNGYSITDPDGNNNGILDPGETAEVHLELANTGQVDASNVLAHLTPQVSLLTVMEEQVLLGTIQAGESTNATFNVSVNEMTPAGLTVEFLLEALAGSYQFEASWMTTVGAVIEDFETGDFSKFDWEFAGNQNWVITNQSWEGDWAAKSAFIGNNQTAEMKLVYQVAADDSISFLRKVSSQVDGDYLRFYIDNDLVEQWSGETGWARVAYAVEAGEHTFRWVYAKNFNTSGGSDMAWIDYIQLPSISGETMVAFAGNDEEICEGTTYMTDGFAQYYNLLNWTTSGSGTFDDAGTLFTSYTPSADDYEAGYVDLTLTAYSTSSDPVSDTMMLSFSPLPGAAGDVAGSVEVCNGTTENYSVAAIANALGYNWELSPEEAGTVNAEGNTAIIEWDDDFIGEAILKVQGVNECGNGEYSGDLVIMVDECSGIADATSRISSISPNPSNGTFQVILKEGVQKARLSMKDMTGKTVVDERSFSGSEITVSAGNLDDGIYFLILDEAGSRTIEKVVISK